MKNNAQKISFIRLFSLFSVTFENLNHEFTRRTLSSVYIHGLKGNVHTPWNDNLRMKNGVETWTSAFLW